MCSFGTERLGQKPQSALDERITEQMFEVRKPAIMMYKGKTRSQQIEGRQRYGGVVELGTVTDKQES